MPRWLKSWVVPGAVFQSVIVGGGYGTGREVVEFISRAGPRGGLAGSLLIGALFSIVLAVAFDYARQFEVRDYRRFLKSLLGPAWVAFELSIIVTLILVLAVAGSAAGTVLEDSFGIPMIFGVGIMLFLVVLFNYYGRQWVERMLTLWGILSSLLLVAYALVVIVANDDLIRSAFASQAIAAGWWRGGLRFFLYTAVIIPTLLYATDHIETRRQAWGAGIVGGFLGALPGAAYHVTFMSSYPAILDEPLPTYSMILSLDIPALLPVYVIMLFGTIALTGVGVLQGINERLDAWWCERHGRPLSPSAHATIAGAALLASLALSNVGIVALVVNGYGSLAWASLFLFVLPVMTGGIWKLWRAFHAERGDEPIPATHGQESGRLKPGSAEGS